MSISKIVCVNENNVVVNIDNNIININNTDINLINIINDIFLCAKDTWESLAYDIGDTPLDHTKF